MNTARSAIWLVGANLLFAACHPRFLQALPGPIASLAIGTLLFALPASGWRARFGSGQRGLGAGIIRDVWVSTVVMLAILGVHRASGTTPTQVSMWTHAWIATNLIFVVASFWRGPVLRRRSLRPSEVAMGAALFVASFGLYYFGATSVVPAMWDQDQEVQATGFSLATRFEPFLLTDRHTFYFFAHPPLLHFYVAGSFLYAGAFPDLEYYDVASRRARDIVEGRPATPPQELVAGERGGPRQYRVIGVDGINYALASDSGGPSRTAPAEKVELDLIQKRYEARPYVAETRTPNVFLAAATVALLGIWGTRISRRRDIGVLMALAYATNPEVFVRSSYGGYYAIGAFAALLMLLAVDGPLARHPVARFAPAFCGAALAALSDHKLALLPAAAGLVALLSFLRVRRLGSNRQGGLMALVVGFAAGTAVFWAFGLFTAPAAFIADHLGTHLLDRVTHDNPLGYGGYPTVPALWLEFISHTAYVLLPLGVILLARDILTSPVDSAHAPERALWLVWILLTALVFSIVDWRMTKHLVPMLLPLHLAIAPDRRAPQWRWVVAALAFVGLIAWNVSKLSLIARDFSAFSVTPVW